MKKKIFTMILFLLAGVIHANQVVVLPGITGPYTITTSNDKLYITESATVYIYSLTDFSLIKKFGKGGSGKGEFKGLISLGIGPDYLFVNSRHKTSFFTTQGEFIKENKKPTYALEWISYTPIGKQWVVTEPHQEYQASFFSRFFFVLLSETGSPSSGFYNTINLYNSNLKKVKKIFTYKHPFFSGKYVNPVHIQGSSCLVYRERLFIDDSEGNIHVFKDDGMRLYSIRTAFEKVKITRIHERRYLKYWMEQLGYLYEQFHGRLRFPEYFPSIRNFFVADQRIYVLTFKEIEGKSELLILDIEGQLLKKVLVPLVKIDSLQPSVINHYTINHNKLYRLVRNEDEQYEIHITELDRDFTEKSKPE